MGNGKSLELFPTILTALAACEALSFGKGKCKLTLFSKVMTNEVPSAAMLMVHVLKVDVLFYF